MAAYNLGCDLGGTNLRVGIVETENGRIYHQRSIPTNAREGHAAVVSRISDCINDVIRESGIPKNELGGVGIGVPGVLNPNEGLVLFLPNLYDGWVNVPLSRMVNASTGLPVFLINDVRAITLGEWKFGAGKDVSSMVCFAIGTGIGGGVVVNDRLVMGFDGTAGELGHMIVEPDGQQCGCGNHGCLEAYASGPAIAAMGIKAVIQGRTTRIGELVGYDLNKITPQVIADAALKGDSIARDIFQYAGKLIGIAAVNVALVMGPDMVVIGGGVASAGDLLLEPIRRTIQERIFVMPKDRIRVEAAKLGGEAGILGAAQWASLKGYLGE
jgi:glucokinase